MHTRGSKPVEQVIKTHLSILKKEIGVLKLFVKPEVITAYNEIKNICGQYGSKKYGICEFLKNLNNQVSVSQEAAPRKGFYSQDKFVKKLTQFIDNIEKVVGYKRFYFRINIPSEEKLKKYFNDFKFVSASQFGKPLEFCFTDCNKKNMAAAINKANKNNIQFYSKDKEFEEVDEIGLVILRCREGFEITANKNISVKKEYEKEINDLKKKKWQLLKRHMNNFSFSGRVFLVIEFRTRAKKIDWITNVTEDDIFKALLFGRSCLCVANQQEKNKKK